MAVRPRFYVQTGSMFENPYGAPHSEIWSMLDEMTPEIAAQTVFGKYVDMSGLVFSAPLITGLFDKGGPRITGNRYLDEQAARQSLLSKLDHRASHHRYATGLDLARKNDFTVITVLDTVSYPARVVYWRRTNRVPWATIYSEVGYAQYLFPGELLIDSTGQAGDVILETIQSQCYCPTHHVSYDAASACPRSARNRDKRCDDDLIFRLEAAGYPFTAQSKADLIGHTQNVLGHGYDEAAPTKEFGAVRSPYITQLAEELSDYAFDDKKLTTDSVFSFALAAWQGIHLNPGEAAFGSPYGA